MINSKNFIGSDLHIYLCTAEPAGVNGTGIPALALKSNDEELIELALTGITGETRKSIRKF